MRLVLALLVALLLPTSAFAAAPFASAVDGGDLPHASAGGWLEEPDRSPRLIVRSWPTAPLSISVEIQCSRGSHKASMDTDLEEQPGPVDRRLKLPMRNSDACYVSVDAWFEDLGQPGTIIAKLYR